MVILTISVPTTIKDMMISGITIQLEINNEFNVASMLFSLLIIPIDLFDQQQSIVLAHLN